MSGGNGGLPVADLNGRDDLAQRREPGSLSSLAQDAEIQGLPGIGIPDHDIGRPAPPTEPARLRHRFPCSGRLLEFGLLLPGHLRLGFGKHGSSRAPVAGSG